MFIAIEPLLRHCEKLTLSLQMKGDQMVVCVMPQGKSKDAAMLHPLALTASAAELDAGFIDALAAYTGAHASLAEQVAATTAILEAAKTTQVSKATKSLGGKGSSKPAAPVAASRSSASSEDDDDDDEHNGNGEGASDSGNTSASVTQEPCIASNVTPPAPANTGTDLASLF